MLGCLMFSYSVLSDDLPTCFPRPALHSPPLPSSLFSLRLQLRVRDLSRTYWTLSQTPGTIIYSSTYSLKHLHMCKHLPVPVPYIQYQ